MSDDTMDLHWAGHRLHAAAAAARSAARAMNQLVRSTRLSTPEAAKAAGFTDPAAMRRLIRKAENL